MCIQYRRRPKLSKLSFPAQGPVLPLPPTEAPSKDPHSSVGAESFENNDADNPEVSVHRPSVRKQRSAGVFALIRRRSSTTNLDEEEELLARLPQCCCGSHRANESDKHNTKDDDTSEASTSPSLTSSDSSVSSSEDSKEGRTVRFGKVHIREYEITVGDNPAVSEAPALSLGWKYYTCSTCKCNTSESWSVEDYDRMRMSKRNKRGPYRYSKTERMNILTSEFGVSKKQIQDASRKITETQRRRERTLDSLREPSYLCMVNGELVLVEGEFKK